MSDFGKIFQKISGIFGKNHLHQLEAWTQIFVPFIFTNHGKSK
jgi:hypothetical protein